MDVESSLEVSLDQYSLSVLQKRQREELGISIHHCREGHGGVGYAKVKAEDSKREVPGESWRPEPFAGKCTGEKSWWWIVKKTFPNRDVFMYLLWYDHRTHKSSMKILINATAVFI